MNTAEEINYHTCVEYNRTEIEMWIGAWNDKQMGLRLSGIFKGCSFKEKTKEKHIKKGFLCPKDHPT